MQLAAYFPWLLQKVFLEGNSKRKISGVKKVAVFLLHDTSLYPSSLVCQILSGCTSHSEMTQWHSASKISSVMRLGYSADMVVQVGSCSTGRVEGLARTKVCWEEWDTYVPRVSEDSRRLKWIGCFVWEGLWLQTATHFVPFFRVGYELQLQPSTNYNSVLIMIFCFKRAEELTTMSEIWCGQSVMQKWLCSREMKDGGERGEIKKKMQLCVLLDQPEHVCLLLLQFCNQPVPGISENSPRIIMPQHCVCFQ